MGHGSKEMIFNVYGNYIEGLEADAGLRRDYYGNDYS
jgi:integrase